MPSERTLADIRSQSGPFPDGRWEFYLCGCHYMPEDGRWRLCGHHEGFDACAERADELQALIDAYAEACPGLTLVCQRDARGTWARWVVAEGNILAAATPKEADHG